VKILVVAKEPVPGRVKTRLCPPLSLAEAAEVAEAALADTLEAVRASAAHERVIALDGRAGPWLPEGFRVVPQRGTTFAERLAAAWEDCGGPTLQIGMDTPQVTSILLDESLEALADNDSVIGLAPDGGWWALGLHAPQPSAFHGVPMSHATTALHQRRVLRSLGLGPALLATLTDVDTWDEAQAVATAAPDGRFGRLVVDLVRRVAAAAATVEPGRAS
jgi:glycosyltransferase A (GT-A) superfamily protein (DUF2064 family)